MEIQIQGQKMKDLKWNKDTKLQDIIQENYSYIGKEYVDLLEKNRIITLEDWKILKKEQKSEYPDDLVHLLDEICTFQSI